MSLPDGVKSLKTETYMPPEDKDVRWMFDNRLFLLELHAKLRGGWIEESKKGIYEMKIPVGAGPMMNEEGVRDTMAVVNGFVDKIQGSSVYTEERILKYTKAIWKALAKFYYVNMSRFDLTPSKASLIITMVVNLYESNIRKSIGGMGLRLIGLSEKIVEQKNSQKKLLPI